MHTRAFAMQPASPRMPFTSSMVGVGWRLPVQEEPTEPTSKPPNEPLVLVLQATSLQEQCKAYNLSP
mgnify:CR=1 FL=1